MTHYLTTILKTLLGFTILCLPFLILTAALGPDTLLDSYQHPDQYHYLPDATPLTQRYLLIKDLDTQGTLQEGDAILYQDDDGAHCATVCAIIPPPTNLVYIAADTTQAISPHDILGRITGSLDRTPWSQLALQIWDLTAHTLNPAPLLTL